ncbi:hypothetical protein DKX38_023892 [Salix brachista]|uniref:Uncharacterized protein n=1 Tax=Salix brachista TaxID=2182728 RepID=A0A5N5JQI0_9ROSI|nr:hypothetical protein DKX38_023889 [Salix brachista]KAB5519573.1 hypothetical protein DKX38_023892 [Salix brachista]
MALNRGSTLSKYHTTVAWIPRSNSRRCLTFKKNSSHATKWRVQASEAEQLGSSRTLGEGGRGSTTRGNLGKDTIRTGDHGGHSSLTSTSVTSTFDISESLSSCSLLVIDFTIENWRNSIGSQPIDLDRIERSNKAHSFDRARERAIL